MKLRSGHTSLRCQQPQEKLTAQRPGHSQPVHLQDQEHWGLPSKLINFKGSSQQIVESRLSFVDDYRNGRLTKIEALVNIISTVTGEVANTPGRRVATVAEPYAIMLDRWDSEKARANGRSAGRSPLPADDRSTRRTERGEPTQKRPKLDFSFVGQSERLKSFSANLKQTNEVLEDWSQDQKEVLRQLMYRIFVPEFHKSGWVEIITGECIDLDIVYTIIATFRAVEKHTETVGMWKYVLVRRLPL